MAGSNKLNLQDVFLNNVRKTKNSVTVFLVNGVKLQGVITWFDNFSLLLRRDGQSQLIYKHAVSTIMPSDPVRLFEQEASEPAKEGKASVPAEGGGDSGAEGMESGAPAELNEAG